MTLDTHPTMDLDVERRLGGVGPFVINLEASAAPMGVPAKSPAGSEQARLYRIQRVDDGRIRYRLRLGPFATADEAEAMLAKVRHEYPCALLVTAATDDLHAIALVRGKTHSGDSPMDTRVTPAPAPALGLELELAPQRPVASVASDIASMQALMAVIDTGFDAAPTNKLTTKPPSLYTVPAAKKDKPLELVAAKAPAKVPAKAPPHS